MHKQLKAGGLDSFTGSMAKAMEEALNEVLASEGKPTVPTDNSDETRDRRIMFVAIARGVVRHLLDKQDAFTIRREDDNTELANHNVVIAGGD